MANGTREAWFTVSLVRHTTDWQLTASVLMTEVKQNGLSAVGCTFCVELAWALLFLVLYPIIWLVVLPFKLLGFAVGSVFHILRWLILLPFRLLGL